jgi:kinesin family member 2/24
MSLPESKHRKMARHDMKKRFSHHQQQQAPTLEASESAKREEEEAAATTAIAAAASSSASSSTFETRSEIDASHLTSPRLSPFSRKRVMTMSQLRHAATRACVLSPLRKLAVAKSPIAQRIRSEILALGRSPDVGAQATIARLPSPMLIASPRLQHGTPRSSSSRRQRLHESRFRRSGGSSACSTGSTSLIASASSTRRPMTTPSQPLYHSHNINNNTPLARYADRPDDSRFFSPPFVESTKRRLLAHSEEKQAAAHVPVAEKDGRAAAAPTTPPSQPSAGGGTGTTKTTPRLPPTTPASSRTPRSGKPRRIASSRSPLQALLGASNTTTAATSSHHRSPSLGASAGSKSSGRKETSADASTTTTRRNLDKRTARLVFRHTFVSEIAQLRAVDKSNDDATQPAYSVEDGNVTVVIRKRPLFPEEASRGDFDVVSMRDGKACTVYKTALQANMKTCVITPITYRCSVALDETSTNPQVYRAVLKPLVTAATQPSSSSSRPPSALLLHFGQTGSGKSFTMAGLERELVHDLMYPVSVQVLEVSGKACRDLLEAYGGDAASENASKSAVRILNSGHVSVVGATWVSVGDPDELLLLLAVAKSLRATQATDRNHESSRSHALVTLRLEINGACLTLVDCAGTEGSYDCMYHSKDRQVESNEINASLYALKECIRARAAVSAHAKSAVVPYRSSTLTSVLRPHLESGGPLAVVATVSPNATDTEHTLGTLRTVASLLGTAGYDGSPNVLAPKDRESSRTSPPGRAHPSAPKSWNHEELVRFLRSKHLLGSTSRPGAATKPSDKLVVPDTLDGRQLMRMNKMQIANALHTSRAVADKVFDLLRAETTLVARLDLKQRVQAKSR